MADFTRFRSNGGYPFKCEFWGRGFPLSCANRVEGPNTKFSESQAVFGEKTVTADNVTVGFWKMKKGGKYLHPNRFLSIKRSYHSIGSSSFVISGVGTNYACTSPNLLGHTTYWGAWFALAVVLPGGAQGFKTPFDESRYPSVTKETLTSLMAERQTGLANYLESLAEIDQAWSMLETPFTNARKFCENFRNSTRYKELERERKKDAARYHKYATLLYQYPKKFARLLRRLRKNVKNGDTVNLMELISSEWLRFRYGISPIISDVQSFVKAAKGLYDKEPTYHSTRAKRSITGQRIDPYVWDYAPWTAHYNVVSTLSFSIRAVYTDLYRVDPFDELGFTFRNLMGLPWELTRLSFVADWFTNIGDLMYANIPRPNMQALGGSYFTIEDKTVVQVPTNVTYTATGYVMSGAISDYVMERVITKQRHDTIDQASLGLVIRDDFRLDRFKRAADALALLQQAMRRLIL